MGSVRGKTGAISVSAAAGDGPAPAAVELELYGDIGGGGLFGPAGITAADVSNALRAHMSASDIRVRINSLGGDVAEGLAIYNMLAQHPARVSVQIDGIAASIASVIAMAGDEIAISEAGMLMIHDPWTGARGDAAEMRRIADVLDKWGASIAGVYAARSGKTPEKMRALMLAETWLDAKEAKRLGLVTSITKNKQASKARAEVGDLVLRGQFRNAPVEQLEALGIRLEETSEIEMAARLEEPAPAVEDAAVPYRPEKPANEPSWDAAAAETRLRKWASSDGSGDKAKIDWAKYRRGFAWYDSDNPERFGSNKLPHHDIVGGEMITVRAGVIAAGNVVNGGRGGVSIPASDMDEVKSHLAKHYAQFGMTAPWKRKASAELEAAALNVDGTIRSTTALLAYLYEAADDLPVHERAVAYLKTLLATEIDRARNTQERNAIALLLEETERRIPRLGDLTEPKK